MKVLALRFAVVAGAICGGLTVSRAQSLEAYSMQFPLYALLTNIRIDIKDALTLQALADNQGEVMLWRGQLINRSMFERLGPENLAEGHCWIAEAGGIGALADGEATYIMDIGETITRTASLSHVVLSTLTARPFVLTCRRFAGSVITPQDLQNILTPQIATVVIEAPTAEELSPEPVAAADETGTCSDQVMEDAEILSDRLGTLAESLVRTRDIYFQSEKPETRLVGTEVALGILRQGRDRCDIFQKKYGSFSCTYSNEDGTTETFASEMFQRSCAVFGANQKK